MQLVDLVAVSRDLSATSSRNAKAVLIADLLTRAAQETRVSAGSGVGEGPGVDEIELVAGYLSGAPRQRRTGIELTHLTVLPPPAAVASVTLDEVDAVLQRAADLSGTGSSAARATLFAGLLARLTADEQRFVTSLLRGGLRQGALESVVLTAVAGAAGAPVAEVRRAVTVSGSLARVASAALREGPQALARFTLTLGQGVSPMLAGSARTVPEALARTGPGGVEWKLDGIRAQIHADGAQVTVLTRSLDDITDRVPEVVEAVAGFGLTSAILDGELIALRDDGRPRPFQQTGSRTASRTDPAAGRLEVPLTLFVFDVLHLDGRDLLDEPGSVRRAVLEATLPPAVLTPRLRWPTPRTPGTWRATCAPSGGRLGPRCSPLGWRWPTPTTPGRWRGRPRSPPTRWPAATRASWSSPTPRPTTWAGAAPAGSRSSRCTPSTWWSSPWSAATAGAAAG